MTETRDNPSSNDVRDQVAELLDTDTGSWLVVTRDSTHTFDLDARTVLREPGPGATDFGDIILPTALAAIESCRVGERGQWRFNPRDRIMQPDRYLSSVIERITRLNPGPGEKPIERTMTFPPDDPIWGRIRECASTIALDFLVDRERPHRRDATAILDAYQRADHFIRSRLRFGQPPPFEEFAALPPGALDVRVFDQDQWWVDTRGTHHRIEEPTNGCVLIVLIVRLLDEAPVHHDAYTRAFPARTVPADPHTWLVETTLMTALLRKLHLDGGCP